MFGNDEDAADLTQDVFISAFKNIQSFRMEAAFGTWLYRIAVNRCSKELRRAGKEKQSEVLDRIAILIVGLGTELSAPILKHCDWDEVQDITQAVIEIRTVLSDRRKAVFEEFRQLLLSGDYVLTGGPEYAKKALCSMRWT